MILGNSQSGAFYCLLCGKRCLDTCGELSLNPKCRGWARGREYPACPGEESQVSLYRFKTKQVAEVGLKPTRVQPVLASAVTSGTWLGTSVCVAQSWAGRGGPRAPDPLLDKSWQKSFLCAMLCYLGAPGGALSLLQSSLGKGPGSWESGQHPAVCGVVARRSLGAHNSFPPQGHTAADHC